MTRLVNPVSRATVNEYRTLYAKARPVVVTLCPGEERIEFRELGRRTRFMLPVDVAFRHAIHLKAAAERAERKARRKGRNGRRAASRDGSRSG